MIHGTVRKEEHKSAGRMHVQTREKEKVGKRLNDGYLSAISFRPRERYGISSSNRATNRINKTSNCIIHISRVLHSEKVFRTHFMYFAEVNVAETERYRIFRMQSTDANFYVLCMQYSK